MASVSVPLSTVIFELPERIPPVNGVEPVLSRLGLTGSNSMGTSNLLDGAADSGGGGGGVEGRAGSLIVTVTFSGSVLAEAFSNTAPPPEGDR